MHRKLRLITTLFTLLSVSVLLMIAIPLGVYAATSAYITGSGKLSVEKVNLDEQKANLDAAGFHTTSGGSILQAMEKPQEDKVSEYRNNSKTSNILSYTLYKKIDCKTQTETFELEITLDFSHQLIAEYARYCFGYYNEIIFAKESYTETMNLVNYNSGLTINENVEVTFNESGLYFTINNIAYDYNLATSGNMVNDIGLNYSYHIILNSNTTLRNNCFKMNQDSSSLIRIPDVTYIDISNTNIYLDSEGVHGIEFGDDLSKIEFTDNNHIHVIGSNDSQLGAGLYISNLYINSHEGQIEDKSFEIALYKKHNNAHTLLCKVSYNNGLVIDVIDSKYYSNGLDNEQRYAILNMCYWIINNMTEVDQLIIYHQLVNSDLIFADRKKMDYQLYPELGENWYVVSYTEDETIIGYFNSLSKEIKYELNS